MAPRPARLIVITAFEGVSLLDLAGPLEAFRVASAFGGTRGKRAAYECVVVSARGGPVRTCDGVELVTTAVASLRNARIDTLVVPGAFDVEDVTRDPALVQWVRTRAPKCRRICSVCVGSFLLAAAGLLDGKRAATHWMYAQQLSARHPKVRVEPDAIFVHDGKLWSSAGVTTGIDLALALIEADAGRDVALHVARLLVVYLKRAGGQSQFSPLLQTQAESEADAFSELERRIATRPKENWSVTALAECVHMSPRNFARAFAKKRGCTPAKAVEAIRVDVARRKLEETDDRIGSIALECGFSKEEQMRCAFVRVLNVSPREYRRRFTSSAMAV